jgi:ABC-type multidrug transport system fused ATPase/permease subunit
MRSIHVLAACTGIVFVGYADLPASISWRYGIYAFILLFIAGGVLSWLARRRDWHRKYIDYRALAEGLRVQRCWRRAGVTTINPSVFAHDHFMQKTDLELGWIRNVMRVPSMERIGDAPVPDWALEAVIADWIGEVGSGGQLDYYSRKTEQRARMQRTTSALGRTSLWLSFGTVLFLALFQDWLGSDTTSLLLAILAVVGIIAAARESYAYRKGDKELIKQYRYMLGIFADARRKIDAEPDNQGKRRILRALGEAAMAEHAEWALMHRQRPLDNTRL